MDELAMTRRDYMNVLKILKCTEKHLVSSDNNGNIKTVPKDRWLSVWGFASKTIFCKLWYIMRYCELTNRVCR